MSGASSNAKWLTSSFDGARDLMSIYDDKNILRSLHLQYLGQADLPGSDAQVNPPPLPATKIPKTKSN
jgi:hypothetical protein